MKIPKLRPRRDSLNQANTDTKLSRTALHYEYMFVWGVDFKNRIIKIEDEITLETFSRLDSALTEMESENRQTVTVKINSPGGSVYDALAIVGRIRNSPCHIVTQGFGAIMSAATLILACGDKRQVSDLAWFMTHGASYAADGTHAQVRAMAKQVEREEQQWAAVMASFTKKPESFWRKTGEHLDAYFTAQELLAFGVVDAIF